MSSKHLYYVLIGLCVLLTAAIIGGTYFGDKLLASQAKRIAAARADEELVDQKKRIKTDLESKISNLAEVRAIAVKFLPDSKNQDILVAEFNKIAKDNKIKVNNIVFDPSSSPSNSSQTKALADTKGVLLMPFSVETEPVEFGQLIDFLADVENNRRKMQVTNITVTPVVDARDPHYGKLKLGELRIEVYLKGTNETAAPKAGATPPPANQ